MKDDRRPTVTRKAVLFVIGIVGLIHEVLVTDGQRPYVLFVLMACTGFPVTKWLDQYRQSKAGEDG